MTPASLDRFIWQMNAENRERFVSRELREAENLREIGLSESEMSIYQARVEGVASRLSVVLSRKPKAQVRATRLFR